MSDAETPKPKKTLELVAELRGMIEVLEERIVVLEDAIKAKQRPPRKEGN